jgi:hypothetical protein
MDSLARRYPLRLVRMRLSVHAGFHSQPKLSQAVWPYWDPMTYNRKHCPGNDHAPALEDGHRPCNESEILANGPNVLLPNGSFCYLLNRRMLASLGRYVLHTYRYYADRAPNMESRIFDLREKAGSGRRMTTGFPERSEDHSSLWQPTCYE